MTVTDDTFLAWFVLLLLAFSLGWGFGQSRSIEQVTVTHCAE